MDRWIVKMKSIKFAVQVLPLGSFWGLTHLWRKIKHLFTNNLLRQTNNLRCLHLDCKIHYLGKELGSRDTLGHNLIRHSCKCVDCFGDHKWCPQWSEGRDRHNHCDQSHIPVRNWVGHSIPLLHRRNSDILKNQKNVTYKFYFIHCNLPLLA